MSSVVVEAVIAEGPKRRVKVYRQVVDVATGDSDNGRLEMTRAIIHNTREPAVIFRVHSFGNRSPDNRQPIFRSMRKKQGKYCAGGKGSVNSAIFGFMGAYHEKLIDINNPDCVTLLFL